MGQLKVTFFSGLLLLRPRGLAASCHAQIAWDRRRRNVDMARCSTCTLYKTQLLSLIMTCTRKRLDRKLARVSVLYNDEVPRQKDLSSSIGNFRPLMQIQEPAAVSESNIVSRPSKQISVVVVVVSFEIKGKFEALERRRASAYTKCEEASREGRGRKCIYIYQVCIPSSKSYPACVRQQRAAAEVFCMFSSLSLSAPSHSPIHAVSSLLFSSHLLL